MGRIKDSTVNLGKCNQKRRRIQDQGQEPNTSQFQQYLHPRILYLVLKMEQETSAKAVSSMFISSLGCGCKEITIALLIIHPSFYPSVCSNILAQSIQQKVLHQVTSFFSRYCILFQFVYYVCHVYQNSHKTENSLMYPIARLGACFSPHIFLLCGLIQSFIIAMLKPNPIIDFMATVVLIHRHCNVCLAVCLSISRWCQSD